MIFKRVIMNKRFRIKKEKKTIMILLQPWLTDDFPNFDIKEILNIGGGKD